jgi:hypothetical protein
MHWHLENEYPMDEERRGSCLPDEDNECESEAIDFVELKSTR